MYQEDQKRAIEAHTKTGPNAKNNCSPISRPRNRFLVLCWDGLERILIAYARMDAQSTWRMMIWINKTANIVADAYGLPESAAQSFTWSAPVAQQTADPRRRQFPCENWRGFMPPRILVSTRPLFPPILQTVTGFTVLWMLRFVFLPAGDK